MWWSWSCFLCSMVPDDVIFSGGFMGREKADLPGPWAEWRAAGTALLRVEPVGKHPPGGPYQGRMGQGTVPGKDGPGTARGMMDGKNAYILYKPFP